MVRRGGRRRRPFGLRRRWGLAGILSALAAAWLWPGDRTGEPPGGTCEAVDGDTLRCGRERIRLIGIDAPEMPGHCRRGRRCAPGDPFAARDSLAAGLGGLTITRVGTDRYGRTLATAHGAGGDLSCRQLERGHAVYRSDWDDGKRVLRACPKAALLG